jgi:hypothetical protein
VSFFSFRVAPGVRVGVSKRGVRTSIGPRAARMHVGGGYRTGLSTGAGPFTLYQSVGHTRRKPRTVTARAAAGRTRTRGTAQATIAAHQREVARAAKADAAEQIQAAFTALSEVHRHPVAPVHPPVAPGPGPVDEAAIRTRSDNVALAGIRPWHLRARGVAKATAAVAAEQEINAARRSRIEAPYLNKRAADVPAYFDRPHTPNEPTKAINGRLEHLRGTALGFRNLTNHVARSLLEAGL